MTDLKEHSKTHIQALKSVEMDLKNAKLASSIVEEGNQLNLLQTKFICMSMNKNPLHCYHFIYNSQSYKQLEDHEKYRALREFRIPRRVYQANTCFLLKTPSKFLFHFKVFHFFFLIGSQEIALGDSKRRHVGILKYKPKSLDLILYIRDTNGFLPECQFLLVSTGNCNILAVLLEECCDHFAFPVKCIAGLGGERWSSTAIQLVGSS